MARAAETYRGARRNAARANRVAMVKFTTVASKTPQGSRVQALPPPRYMPYFCKPPRIRFAPWGEIQVPYTDLRKQPRVYRCVTPVNP